MEKNSLTNQFGLFPLAVQELLQLKGGIEDKRKRPGKETKSKRNGC